MSIKKDKSVQTKDIRPAQVPQDEPIRDKAAPGTIWVRVRADISIVGVGTGGQVVQVAEPYARRLIAQGFALEVQQ